MLGKYEMYYLQKDNGSTRGQQHEPVSIRNILRENQLREKAPSVMVTPSNSSVKKPGDNQDEEIDNFKLEPKRRPDHRT